MVQEVEMLERLDFLLDGTSACMFVEGYQHIDVVTGHAMDGGAARVFCLSVSSCLLALSGIATCLRDTGMSVQQQVTCPAIYVV